MKILGLYIVTPVISFLGGFYVFVWLMKLFLNDELGGDTGSLLFWGGIAFFIFAVPFYLVLIHFIDKVFCRLRVILYPLVCMLGFFVPYLVITSVWGSQGFFKPIDMLFHSFFITSGLIFGLLNWSFKKIIDLKKQER